MISYTLNIAGYNILFQSKGNNLKLRPSAPQLNFVTDSEYYDTVVNIIRSPVKIFPGAREVFRAPYVEEINGVRVKKNEKFWTVYKHGEYILVHTSMPLSDDIKEAMIIIRPGEKAWDIVMDTGPGTVNPFEYPIDGLFLYYLTALGGDVFIHGSGAYLNGRGFLFSGPSGRGKTTMARLFSEAGARVVHDDRLIIRRKEDAYFMYNTPVYAEEKNCSAPLNGIYIIEHGKQNQLSNLNSVDSVTRVLSNCIQHNWNSVLIGKLTGAIMAMTSSVPVSGLAFVPDHSVIEFLHEKQHKQ